MPLFSSLLKRNKAESVVGEPSGNQNNGRNKQKSRTNNNNNNKAVKVNGGGKPPLTSATSNAGTSSGILRIKSHKNMAGAASAAGVVPSSNSSVASQASSDGGSSRGSKRGLFRKCSINGNSSTDNGNNNGNSLFRRGSINDNGSNIKKQKEEKKIRKAQQRQSQHPDVILSSADSSVSSVASSCRGDLPPPTAGSGARSTDLGPPPAVELTMINSVVMPTDVVVGVSNSWDAGCGGDDSSHHSSSGGGCCCTSVSSAKTAGGGSSSNHSHTTPTDSNQNHQPRGGSSRPNSFKKESLRRSVSTGSNPKMMTHSTSAIGLDEMIEDRRVGGDLGQNVVHIEVPFGKPIEEVYDGVHNGPVLGSGIAGMVRLVTHKATGLKYAVKVLDLSLVETPTGLQQLREEIFIMCQLDHPNIVRLEEVYESDTEIYLVQELCLGGELFDRLDEQPDYHYTEAECARLVKQMLSAVRYLHSKGIIHRDLKLENFLFSSVHEDAELKMIDFGLSKHFRYGEVHHEAVGTPYTVAPEVIRGTYDERCDVWAIGVISFLLLSGEPPFGGCGGPEPLKTVRSNILNGRYAFEPAEIWYLVSPQAKSFIRSLLVTDPQARPTAQEAQQHEWFQEWGHLRNGGSNVLSANVVKALVNFKEFSDMRKLLCEVLSFTLLPDQIRDLRREFEKMDTDGSGEISLAALKQVLMQNAGSGSLGALTEEEVTDIFDAMRVRKSETRIHWHEFIAAGLSQCSVDDRNLRLAFDRLDSDHKGYIILDDIMDLMGSDALQSEDAMRQMWGESIKAVKCQHARITYDDFLLLMKGQTRDNPPDHHLQQQQQQQWINSAHGLENTAAAGLSSTLGLQAVPESRPVENGSSVENTVVAAAVMLEVPDQRAPRVSAVFHSHSAPVTPADHKKIIDVDEDDFADSPLSMDDGVPVSSSLTPPMTPERGPNDYLSPRNERFLLHHQPAQQDTLFIPSFPVITPSGRGRSQSLGERREEAHQNDDSERSKDRQRFVECSACDNTLIAGDLHAVADAVRDLILPEADHGARVPPDLAEVVKDKTKSALVVNRRLYRAHRQMRLAVMEASKRFEEQQTQHARDVILAQREQNQEDELRGVIIPAGLVMRHGHKKQVSSEAIRAMLDRDRAEQQTLVEIANRRGGRGRRSRKKTISDMSAMLSSCEDFNNAAAAAASPSNMQCISMRSSVNSSLASDSFSRESCTMLDEVGDVLQPLVQPGQLLPSIPSSTTGIGTVSAPCFSLPGTVTNATTAAMTTSEPRIGNLEMATTRTGGGSSNIISVNNVNNAASVGAVGVESAAAAAKEGPTRSATIPGNFKKTRDPFGSQGKYGATISHWKN